MRGLDANTATAKHSNLRTRCQHALWTPTAAYLQGFHGLKALYLDCNALTAVENLAHMTQLRSLYLSKNVLRDLGGLRGTPWLQTLDLSNNDFAALAPLAALLDLRTLNLAHNKVADARELAHLASCTALETLDLAHNRIGCEDALQEVTQLPVLLLRLVGNPVVSSIQCARLVMSGACLRRALLSALVLPPAAAAAMSDCTEPQLAQR